MTVLLRAADSFDERHLVDFAQRRLAEQHLLDGALAKEPHALGTGGFLDFRRRAFGENQLADVVAEIEQFADRGPAAIARAAAFHAAGAFEEPAAELERGIERRLLELRPGNLRRTLAVHADVP